MRAFTLAGGRCGTSRRFRPARRGFTLVEVLVATALTLIVMAVTVTLFASVTENISGTRAIIEMSDRLRNTHERLILDLRGMTAPTLPPLRPESGLGYFEYAEGPTGSNTTPSAVDINGSPDTTVGDMDDILMFTTRTTLDPFIGRFGGTAAQSQVAEVAWFVRGTTLYRRVLLVLPNAAITADDGFYGTHDLSVRQSGGTQDPQASTPSTAILVPNSLGDLTKRENRYAHNPRKKENGNFTDDPLCGFPHDITRWGQLGLPTLRECSDASAPWPFPWYKNTAASPVPVTMPAPVGTLDYWTNPHPAGLDPDTGALSSYLSGTRFAEDVILTNVIGFDVKAWDPTCPLFASGGSALTPDDDDYQAEFQSYVDSGSPTPIGFGAYVNLDYTRDYGLTSSTTPTLAQAQQASAFSGPGYYNNSNSFYDDTFGEALEGVYDTWSTHYESDGLDTDFDFDTTSNGSLDSGETLVIDEGTDGVDNDGAGGIDDAGEREAPPPYPMPLRGIQVKIRVYEPDSRQIREVTVAQDFLPE